MPNPFAIMLALAVPVGVAIGEAVNEVQRRLAAKRLADQAKRLGRVVTVAMSHSDYADLADGMTCAAIRLVHVGPGDLHELHIAKNPDAPFCEIRDAPSEAA